jgi:hypothetical protein
VQVVPFDPVVQLGDPGAVFCTTGAPGVPPLSVSTIENDCVCEGRYLRVRTAFDDDGGTVSLKLTLCLGVVAGVDGTPGVADEDGSDEPPPPQAASTEPSSTAAATTFGWLRNCCS